MVEFWESGCCGLFWFVRVLLWVIVLLGVIFFIKCLGVVVR